MTDAHRHLAEVWARYKNQRGTEKQVARIAKQLTEADLRRMLTERGQARIIAIIDENIAYGATHETGLDGISRLKCNCNQSGPVQCDQHGPRE